MPAKKTTKAAPKTTVDTDIARKIWLAGVGAYGRMFTEAQDAAEKLATGANEAFDQLVAKGEEVEDKVRETIAKSPQGEKVVTLVNTATSKMGERRAALDARIGAVRKTVTEALAPLNMAALAQSVEKLSVQVETLTAEVTALKAEKKAPARKSATTEDAAA